MQKPIGSKIETKEKKVMGKEIGLKLPFFCLFYFVFPWPYPTVSPYKVTRLNRDQPYAKQIPCLSIQPQKSTSLI